MKVAFYIGKGHLFNGLIRMIQRLNGAENWKISHCEVILKDLGNGFYLCGSSSAMDYGVRMKAIDLTDGKWVIAGEDGGEDEAIEWLKRSDGKRYDWLGVVGTVLKFVGNKKDEWFCSEVCANLVGIGGAPKPAELYRKMR